MRWLLKRADWPAFQTKATSLLSETEMPSDVNEMAIKLTDILTRAANDHIPKSSINTKKRMYWCYYPIVQTAKLLLNRAIRRYKKEKNDSNKQSMRKAEEASAITCNTAKNSHWNKWVSEIMKQVPASYLTALAKLYTTSLKSGKLPRAWKEAKIVPIPKKSTNAYRLKSLLPVQSKLIDKIILQKI